jgi:acetyl-CoA acetyltransferase
VAGASAGVHPDIMGVGPIPAVGRVLSRSGWKLEDMQTAELNEAFAAQALAVEDGSGSTPSSSTRPAAPSPSDTRWAVRAPGSSPP